MASVIYVWFSQLVDHLLYMEEHCFFVYNRMMLLAMEKNHVPLISIIPNWSKKLHDTQTQYMLIIYH